MDSKMTTQQPATASEDTVPTGAGGAESVRDEAIEYRNARIEFLETNRGLLAAENVALKAELAALREQVATLTLERDAERQRGDNNHKLLMNAVKRNIDLKGQMEALEKGRDILQKEYNNLAMLLGDRS